MTAFLVGLLAALIAGTLAVNERLQTAPSYWLILLLALLLAGVVVVAGFVLIPILDDDEPETNAADDVWRRAA